MKAKLLFNLILFSASSILTFGSSLTYIKLSFTDCVTCTSSLTEIMRKNPKAVILLNSEYVMDSTDLIEKFGLSPYQKNIVWDEDLYIKFNKNEFSEVIEVCNEKEVFRTLLKGFYDYQPHPCNENSCNYKVSKTISIKDFKKNLIVKNYLTDKFYSINKEAQTITLLSIENDLIRRAFAQLHDHNNYYDDYLFFTIHHTDLKAKITTSWSDESGQINAILRIPYINKVEGEDTFFNIKLFLLTSETENFDEASKIATISWKDLPQKYYPNDYNFFSSNNRIYSGLTFPTPDTNSLVIAKYDLSNNRFDVEALPVKIPKFLIENNINYNYSTPIVSENYVTETLWDFVYDLKNNKKIYYPFQKNVTDENKSLMNNYDIKYGVMDVKFNEKKNLFTILYELGDIVYIGTFVKGENKFITNIKLHSQAIRPKKLVATCLSSEGDSIYYFTSDQNCLQNISIQDLEKNNVFNQMD